MSTRSTIAYKDKDGIHSIYCHFDGYVEKPGVGYMLTKYYNNENSAKEVVSLGDMSCLKEKLYPTTKTHSFNTPEKKVSVFYHRDRGEDLHIGSFKTEMEWKDSYDMDYFYLWDEDKWNCWDYKGVKIDLYE